MVDTRSAYELERDSNVQRNNAFLSSIGLRGGLVPRKVVKPKTQVAAKARLQSRSDTFVVTISGHPP